MARLVDPTIEERCAEVGVTMAWLARKTGISYERIKLPADLDYDEEMLIFHALKIYRFRSFNYGGELPCSENRRKFLRQETPRAPIYCLCAIGSCSWQTFLANKRSEADWHREQARVLGEMFGS